MNWSLFKWPRPIGLFPARETWYPAAHSPGEEDRSISLYLTHVPTELAQMIDTGAE